MLALTTSHKVGLLACAGVFIAFALLSIEMFFRMRRLMHGERGPREDAVSAA